MYTAAMGCLGKDRGTQSKEQHNCTFSVIVLKGKLREAVRFVCSWETGGFLQPGDLSLYKMGVINETITYVLVGKHLHKKILPTLCWRLTENRLFLFLWTSERIWFNRLCGIFWGVRALDLTTWKIYRRGF